MQEDCQGIYHNILAPYCSFYIKYTIRQLRDNVYVLLLNKIEALENCLVSNPVHIHSDLECLYNLG